MQRLQRICDLYADRRTIQYTKPIVDISFLYCARCTCPVNVFSDSQQMACMTCFAFLCPLCPDCKCGAAGSLVSDPDTRYGRLTELYALPFVFRCTVCPFFCFSGAEHSTHLTQHEMDMAPLSIHVAKSKTVTLVGIGSVRLVGSVLTCKFTDLPYSVTTCGRTASGHHVSMDMPSAEHPVIISSAFCETNADICTVARNNEQFLTISRFPYEQINLTKPSRPICYTGINRITVSELSRLKRALLQTYLLFFVPPTAKHDSFSVAIYDKPWHRTAVVVCTGCLAEFASLDQLAAHLKVEPDWSSARRIDDTNGDFFSVDSACTAYTHATDIKFESLPRIQRDVYCNMPGKLSGFISSPVFGLMMLPTPIGRFIGVVVVSDIVYCALCNTALLCLNGMTATAVLHPIASHFALPPDIVTEFRQITLYNGHYEIDGTSITELKH